MGTEPTIHAEHIEEAKAKYDEVCEAFLDDVFGYDTTKTIAEWNKLTNEK